MVLQKLQRPAKWKPGPKTSEDKKHLSEQQTKSTSKVYNKLMEMKAATKRGYQKEKYIPTDDNVFELSADIAAIKLIAVTCLFICLMYSFRIMAQGRSRKRHNACKNCSNSAPPCLKSSKKLLRWENEAMMAAMKVVKGGCSIKRAAEEHNVPRTTLND